MLALAICLTFIALAALFGAAYVVAHSHQTQQKIVSDALELARDTFDQACKVASSQQEAATKYVTSNAQTANLISEKIDQRVKDRVKILNVKPGMGGNIDPIEDAPEMPPIYQSGIVDDESEIYRENNRPKKMNFEYPAREMDDIAEEI
jgi:hypothetical protein